MSRVVVAMSGGVDSSVAAWLLRRQGHEVLGVFIRHGQGPSDPAGAEAAAEKLGIELRVLDCREQFNRIVEYFVDEYTAGRTPNPCIVCNAQIKFGRLIEYADELGAEFLATGHYARLLKLAEGEIALCRAADESKDQAYVLLGIRRRLLPRLIFPLGEHRKQEIRQLAEQIGLHAADRPESQEICFVPDRDHTRFVREHSGRPDTAGEIVTVEGRRVGRHDGFERFTIGQRRGLRVAMGEPYFVVRIEPETRRVVIGPKEQLARKQLVAAGANWLVDEPAEPFRCRVKIRYRSRPEDATVEPLGGGRFRVCFDGPRYGIAPGQAAACYQGNRLLGGGWIE